ncbi:peptidase inhibitor family I36 protein [Streptomyces sp. NPDC102274]|uniref:peptidase inhibitor family I36 protein n=1 Tax=Streptomyces sp. NPDC102274 TaxID=3366151 RepID=UPI0038058925
MRRKLQFLAPAFGVLLLPLTLASSAQADEARVMAGSCTAPNFCLFENNHFNEGNTNHWRDIVHSDSDFRGNHWRDGNGNLTDDDMNDETSSVKNESGCSVRLYQNPNYQGDYTGTADGDSRAVLGDFAIGDNRATSAQFNC